MKKEITIPSDLNEVRLCDYQKLLEVAQQNPDATDFLNFKTVQYLCGIPFETVRKISKVSFDEIIKDLNLMLEQGMKKQPLTRRFKLRDVEYGFIPNLEDISAGEFADLDTYFNEWSQMHKAMSVLYRPISQSHKESYTIEEYQGSNDSLKEMPLGIVLGAQLFFWRLGSALSNHILKSFREEEAIALQQTLGLSGDGISLFMQSLEETSLELKKLQNRT